MMLSAEVEVLEEEVEDVRVAEVEEAVVDAMINRDADQRL